MANNSQNSPTQQSLPLGPAPGGVPERIAQIVQSYVRAGIKISVWAALGTLTLAGGFVFLRAIIWAVRLSVAALGI